MVRKAERPRHIVDTTLRLAAEGQWAHIGLRDIATASGVSLAELHELYPSKVSIIRGWSDMLDATVLELSNAMDPEDAPRDRLFDVLMRRFEAMQEHRAAIAAILQASCRDPLTGLCMASGVTRSMRWMLEAAGIRTVGPKGRMITRGLAGVWLATLRVWLKDDSADMAATMAALDRNLIRAERLVSMLPTGRRRRTPDVESEADAAPA